MNQMVQKITVCKPALAFCFPPNHSIEESQAPQPPLFLNQFFQEGQSGKPVKWRRTLLVLDQKNCYVLPWTILVGWKFQKLAERGGKGKSASEIKTLWSGPDGFDPGNSQANQFDFLSLDHGKKYHQPKNTENDGQLFGYAEFGGCWTPTKWHKVNF